MAMLLRSCRGRGIQAAVISLIGQQRVSLRPPLIHLLTSFVRRASGTSSLDADDSITAGSWHDLGYHPTLATALAQNFPSPTTIQELAAAPLLNQKQASPATDEERQDFSQRKIRGGNARRRNDRAHCHDAIVCAETGSGKTIAYAAPLLSKLLFEHEQATLSGGHTPPCCLILCPNVLLCEQVLGVMSQCWGQPAGRTQTEAPLFNFQFLSGSTRPMTDIADIVQDSDPENFSTPRTFPFAIGRPNVFVSTPSGLLKHLTHFMDRGRQRHFVQSIRHLVLDEADALLSGFDQDIRGVVTLFVYGSADEKGAAKFAKRDLAKYIAVNRGKMEVPQVVFAGATIPTQATKAAGSVLKKALPDAEWVEGEHKHRMPPQLRFKWLRLLDGREASRYDAVLSVCLSTIKSAQEISSANTAPTILVFCNTVSTVDRLTAHLQEHDVDAKAFHKKVPESERRELLANVQQKVSDPTHGSSHVHVMVSTDTAARGLDLPNVVHVVQADFSSSAIAFVHRCGRTARAGRPGSVTSVIGDGDMVLMKALRRAVEASEPLDELFSRRRSFRKAQRKRAKRERAFP